MASDCSSGVERASWTFAEARDAARTYAGRLREAGIERGDRVALICGNRIEFMQTFLGCGWLGAVSVPVNTASRGMQLQHILRNSGAKLLVIDPEAFDALRTVDFQSLDIRMVWVVGGAQVPHDYPVDRTAFVSFPPKGSPVEPAAVGLGDPMTILYTSGTTGLSKGVICPHGQFYWWGVYTAAQLGVAQGDVLHTALPLFHTNALNCFFQALLHGATQVVEHRFSVSGFWASMKRSDATVTYLLGAMVPMLLSRPEAPDEHDHTVRVALAPGVPAHFHSEFSRRTGIVLLDGFGTTESNAVITSTETTRRLGWIGKLVDGFEGMVVDENDNPLPDGQAGEFLLRAREPFSMALGYFGMPEKTVEAWRNLWLHTGDRLVRSPDGYFRFV